MDLHSFMHGHEIMLVFLGQLSIASLIKDLVNKPLGYKCSIIARNKKVSLPTAILLILRLGLSLKNRISHLLDGMYQKASISFINGSKYGGFLTRLFHLKMGNSRQPIPKFIPNKKSVLHVITNLGAGGAEKQAWITATGQKKQFGLDVTFLTHEHKGKNFHRNESEASSIKFLTWNSRTLNALSFNDFRDTFDGNLSIIPHGILEEVYGIYEKILQNSPETIHIWLSHNHIKAGLAAYFAGVPNIILSARSLAAIRYSFWSREEVCIYRWLIRKPNVKLVTNSVISAREHEKWLGLAPYDVGTIPNGVLAQPPKTSKDLLPNLWPKNAFIIGSIFRFEEVKDPYLWIEIAEKVSHIIPHARFIIIGDGPLKKELIKFIKDKGLSAKIHFSGNLENPIDLAHMFHVFLLTSRREGMPNVLLEAQGIGIPVVAPDVGGCNETFINNETGILVKDRKTESFVNAVLELKTNPRFRDNARTSGKARIEKEFSIETMLQNTSDIYYS